MSYMEPWKMIKVRERTHERLDQLRHGDFKAECYWDQTTFGDAIDKLIEFYNNNKDKVEEVES